MAAMVMVAELMDAATKLRKAGRIADARMLEREIVSAVGERAEVTADRANADEHIVRWRRTWISKGAQVFTVPVAPSAGMSAIHAVEPFCETP
jgi:hypothetical protein